MKVHDKFDRIWRWRHLTRPKAYAMLASGMDLPVEQCHIAMFDLDQCRKALDVVTAWNREHLSGNHKDKP